MEDTEVSANEIAATAYPIIDWEEIGNRIARAKPLAIQCNCRIVAAQFLNQAGLPAQNHFDCHASPVAL